MPDNLGMLDAPLVLSASRKRTWQARRARSSVALLRATAAVLRRLPERPLHVLAHRAALLLYAAQPRRRALVRSNLQRVCTYLAANDLGGPSVAASARDRRALERLVRASFGHYVRGYLEGAILPAYATPTRLARVRPDDPRALARAFGTTGAHDRHGPLIIVGMHFGALEIPALWATQKLGRPITAPMETVTDPELQAYFEQTRRQTGLNVVPMERAAVALRASLARGEAVALVADRAIGGTGARVELFGSVARLPLGPAALALESGAEAWLVATRRIGSGEYRAYVERIEMPAEGSRRERLSAFLTAEARAFERAVADAPEQWWTMFFPIWDDIPA